MENQNIANINNPTPILQQTASSITTNPFIPVEQQEKELQIIQENANQIIVDEYNSNVTSSLKNIKVGDIHKYIANSIIGLMDDLFQKPKDKPWLEYILDIFQKDNRYAYIGLFLVIISIIWKLLES